jgi:hypothetical protein
MIPKRLHGRIATRWACLVVVGLILTGAVAGGCQLAYFLVDPDKEQAVKAEYGKIGNRSVAVVVWADQATLDVYPRARERLCRAVTYYMKQHLPKARPVEPRRVARLQDRIDTDWESMSVRRLCEKLECDMILRVDLLEYTTRATGTRELRRGRIRATVNLHEGGDRAAEASVYETEVKATYPPTSWRGVADLDEGQILHETAEVFAQAVMRKFYDHGMPMRGQSRH